MERHDTLLIASKSAQTREHLRSVLGEGFHLLETVNIGQMLLLLKQNYNCIAALLLDITQISEADKELFVLYEHVSLLREVPIIVLTRDENTEQLNRAFNLGAADVIPLDYEPYAMLHRIENIAQLHLHKQNLEVMVAEQAQELRHASNAMVEAMSAVIEHRSVESGQHILRIRHFTEILLEEVVHCCPEYGLNEQMIGVICSAAALHDIGKIAIPDSILLKPGKLTAEEMAVMKTHTTTGCEILATLTNVAEEEYLRYAYNICCYHHERWDGNGYPEGLRGDEIPICAQVVGLADVYDALTTRRVYKDAVPFSKAVNMILNGECGVFSPKLLECFKHVIHRFEKLARDYEDGMSPAREHFDASLPRPKQEYDENSMERIRGKYYSLVHYINGFVMDLDMDAGLFHVVYNPYPDLAQFQDISTFADMEQMIMEELIHPDDRARMHRLIHGGIGAFLREGLRRQSEHFRFRSRRHPEGERFEVTLMRINSANSKRNTLTVLVCRGADTGSAQTLDRANSLSDAVYSCRNDRDFTLIEADSEASQVAGYSMEEIRKDMGGRLIELIHPDDRDAVRSQTREQLRHGIDVKLAFRLLQKDGRVCWVLNKSRLRLDKQGKEYLHCAVTDITQFQHINDELKDKLERYELILAQTENALFEWDATTDRIDFSGTWEKIFGYLPLREQLHSRLTDGTHLHPDDLPLLLDAISNIENGSDYEVAEVRIATARGRYLWCRIRATAIRGKEEKLEKIAGVIVNIDAEKQAEQALQERAERDSLTKLLNKEAGRRQAEEYFARYPGGVHSALLIIDLDNFKQVNDRYGHLFGDAVLTQLARELKKLFRSQDIVSRIGGDEFMVLMRGISDKHLLESRCRRLLEIFRNLFQNQKHRLPLSCSVGIALSPAHGKTYYELFSKADRALYQAKASGKNGFVFYSEADEKAFLYKDSVSAVNNRIDSDDEPDMTADNLVRYAFQRLYASADVKAAVNDVLELAGRKMNVSRVYIFENSDDNRFCSNTFEWCNEGIAPEIQNLQDISYEADIAGYVDMYDEKGIFYCPDINELPQNIYDIVAPQGIKSLLHCAIRDGGVFRGYIGFDECVEQRYWTKEQIQTLAYYAEMISVFLLKQRKQENAVRYAAEMQSILENQNAWIYIIDPDTCCLKYVNRKSREMKSNMEPGQYCYKAIMGREERCAQCPAQNIRQRKNGRTMMYNERLDRKVLADAALIRWEGEDACLLTCREIPKDE